MESNHHLYERGSTGLIQNSYWISVDWPSALGSMVQQSLQPYCQRVDPSKNMARYYAPYLQPTLFGEISRIGARGQEKIHFCANEREAIACSQDRAAKSGPGVQTGEKLWTSS